MAFTYRGYLKETRRPIYSAALVLPFFLIYHVGTVFLKTTHINGADALIIRVLSALSVHSIFASALVLALSFVIWQLQTRASCKVDSSKLVLLFAESVGFAMLLYVVFGWMGVYFAGPARSGYPAAIERLVLYCGAGIYEELVFRGFLAGALLLLFGRVLGLKRTLAAAGATVVGALLFALFHYVGSAADPFTLSSFLQRTAGGFYFSLLFVTRGFGVTAAAHALYDILVGLAA
jgi:membrane protease YdiL (CAAX protease family)